MVTLLLFSICALQTLFAGFLFFYYFDALNDAKKFDLDLGCGDLEISLLRLILIVSIGNEWGNIWVDCSIIGELLQIWGVMLLGLQ